MENKTTLTGPRIYQKGEGAGKFIKSHYLGYFPESKLMYAMLIAALGGMMFLVMEESLMGSAMSGGLADSLNASPNTMSWVLSSVSLGTICGFPLAGPIADKIGRRALVQDKGECCFHWHWPDLQGVTALLCGPVPQVSHEGQGRDLRRIGIFDFPI